MDAVPKRRYPITKPLQVTSKNSNDPNCTVAETWNVAILGTVQQISNHSNLYQIRLKSFYQFLCCFTRSDEEILLDTSLGCEQAYKEKKQRKVWADRAAAA